MEKFISNYKNNSNDWNYKDKLILAPMVRVGTLPMRMLCMEYGADIVYSQEYMDDSINCWTREVNNNLIQYVAPSGKILFKTYKDEPLSFQIGTADSIKALRASQKVYNDVKAIDINMGCPLPFSTRSGKGAALLKNPEKINDILKTLKRNLNKPITCKIRLLDNINDTINLVKIIDNCNVDAFGVHCRYIADRSKRERAKHEQMINIINEVNTPTIVNGDIFDLHHIIDVKEKTKADSLMIARGAIWNPSIFKKDKFINIDEVAKKYINYSKLTNNYLQNSKYVLKSMLCPQFKKIDLSRMISRCDTYNDLVNLIDNFEFSDYKVPKKI